MAYTRVPPPSVERMLEDFANWMAQHASAKVTVRIDYRDGTHQTTEIDHRGPLPKPMTKAEMRDAAKNDPSCVGAFARARPWRPTLSEGAAKPSRLHAVLATGQLRRQQWYQDTEADTAKT